MPVLLSGESHVLVTSYVVEDGPFLSYCSSVTVVTGEPTLPNELFIFLFPLFSCWFSYWIQPYHLSDLWEAYMALYYI